jgi:hypothetical protein
MSRRMGSGSKSAPTLRDPQSQRHDLPKKGPGSARATMMTPMAIPPHDVTVETRKSRDSRLGAGSRATA